MNQTLAGILSTQTTGFDAVKDARELRAALDNLTSKTPAVVREVITDEIIRKTDNSDPTPAIDPSVAEFRKLARVEESR